MRISVILLILLLVASPVCNAISSDSVKAKEILANTYQNLEKLDRYHLDIVVTALLPLQDNTFNIVINAECDTQTKPVLGKGTARFTMETPTRSVTQKAIYYFEEADNQLIGYSNIKDNTWIKQSLPYSPLDSSKKNNLMEYITKISVLSEDKDAIVLKVTLNGNCILKELTRHMPADSTSQITIINQLFSNIDDFDYTVRIDKKIAAKARFDFDLSGLIAQIGKNASEMNGIDAQHKADLLKFCNNSKLSATVSYSKLDNSEPIIIPAEVKAQAAEYNRQLITAQSPDPASITPPRVKMSPPVYPLEARINAEEGTVRLQVTISATGKPENIVILQSSGSKSLDAAALDSIRQWEFFPARLHGKPIACAVTLPIIFKLEEEALPVPAAESGDQENAAAAQ